MLESTFQWLGALAVSRAINESTWMFATIQAVHLLFLAMFFGAVLIVDLRLLGSGTRQQKVSQVARDARPWFIWGFVGLVVTGVPQMMSLAEKEYNSDFFWLKMYFMVAALIFTFTIRDRVTRADEPHRMWGKLVALTSIVLWSGVAIPARLIGLF